MESNEYNYNKYIDTPEKKKKFETRLNELIKTANEFIEEAGYSDNVECYTGLLCRYRQTQAVS